MIRKINFEVDENLIKSDLKNDTIPRELLDNGDIVMATSTYGIRPVFGIG